MTIKPPPAPPKAMPRKIEIPKKSKPTDANANRVPVPFTVAPLTGDGEGEKILIYGMSGQGKTTLAGTLENAVFLPIDDGARKIRNAITGQPLMSMRNPQGHPPANLDELRDAIRQAVNVVPEGGALVLDTITRAQAMIEDWVVENVKDEKGNRVTSIERFGFGKGYRHVHEVMRNLLSDLDAVSRSGRHVVLLAQLDQANVSNASGTDYLKDVPALTENKQGRIRSEVTAWCDHVFYIGFNDLSVLKEDKDDRRGKAVGGTGRVIYTQGQAHFEAKNRGVNGSPLPSVIGFSSPDDDSLWQFLFHGAQAE